MKSIKSPTRKQYLDLCGKEYHSAKRALQAEVVASKPDYCYVDAWQEYAMADDNDYVWTSEKLDELKADVYRQNELIAKTERQNNYIQPSPTFQSWR